MKESVGAGGAGDGPTPETLLSLNSNTEAWQSGVSFVQNIVGFNFPK